MATIVLTPAQLEAKKTELATYCKTLQTQISELQGVLRSLEAVWEGNAAEAFQKRGTAEIRRLENMYKVFDSYIVALDKAMIQYKNTERINVSLANG